MYGDKLKWCIDLMDMDRRGRRGVYAEIWFRSSTTGMGLYGMVITPARPGRPPIVRAIQRNDCLLPDRMARRILRRVHDLYWWLVVGEGHVAMTDQINLGPWLVANFGDEGLRMLELIRRAVRTFQEEGASHER